MYSKSELLAKLRAPTFPPTDNPFANDEWRRHWIEQIGRDEWRFHIARDISGRPAMILYSEPSRPYLFRQATNYYTILAPASQAHFPGHVVELRPLAEDSATEALETGLRQDGWYTRRTFAHGNWFLPCAGVNYEDYISVRPSQLRNTLKRKAKRFAKVGTVEVHTGTDGLEDGIAAYESVYLRSWKRPEPYPGFVPGWMHICASRGWLRLAVARIGSTPIAAQFWFVYAGRAHVYKLAYDEAYKEHSAGTILTARLMEHVLDQDHVREIDYGSGDDPYKRDWMSSRRERITLTAIDQSRMHGKLLALRERLAVATAPLRRARCMAGREY